MLGASNATPFKIHDENDVRSSVAKSGAKRGLGGPGGGTRPGDVHSVLKTHKTASKKGIGGLGMSTPVAPKSTGRRALGELSNAKLNTVNRLVQQQQSGFGMEKRCAATALSGSTANGKLGLGNSLGKLSFKLAVDDENSNALFAPLNSVGGEDYDMICSSSTAVEDPHDCAMRKASAIDVVLLPAAHTHTADTSTPTEQEEDWGAQFAENVSLSDNYDYGGGYDGGYDGYSGYGDAAPESVFSLPVEEPDFD